MRSVLRSAMMAMAVGGLAVPAVADQAQMLQQQVQQQSEQQALQQQQQAQQLQQQLQDQQLQLQQNQQSLNQSWGLAGVQPYCNSYGTCPNPFPPRARTGPDVGALLGGGPSAEEPQSAVYPPADDPRAPHPVRHRHHRGRHPASQ